MRFGPPEWIGLGALILTLVGGFWTQNTQHWRAVEEVRKAFDKSMRVIESRVTAVETKEEERHATQLRVEAKQDEKLDRVLELIQKGGE